MIYGIQAQKVIDLQRPDGSWGCFHTLSRPTKERPITTEQALRRLYVLGLTKEDEPIQKALEYMKSCLLGQRQPPDGREKVLNWDVFERHMLSTWIKLFEPDNALALSTAHFWAEIIAHAFQDGAFSPERYAEIYRRRIPVLHKGERLIRLSQFYMVNLLKGMLDPRTEEAFVDHIIHDDEGILYVYGHRIADLPQTFASRQTGQYLAALACLSGYTCAPQKLRFAMDWINSNKNGNGLWDLGPDARDGIYLPLSDSWRKQEDRIRDCTARIEALLYKMR